MKRYSSQEFLDALGGGVGCTEKEKKIADLAPHDRLPYAILVLADVLDERLGEFTFHVGDGTEMGALEKLISVLEDKLGSE